MITTHRVLKSHKSKMCVIYMCNHENNVPSELSPQQLCGNSCTWAHDIRTLFSITDFEHEAICCMFTIWLFTVWLFYISIYIHIHNFDFSKSTAFIYIRIYTYINGIDLKNQNCICKYINVNSRVEVLHPRLNEDFNSGNHKALHGSV